ncbi:type II secretion system protein [Clostridium sp. LIBA-8841]|uniref:type II secretion system protein n=1 Tax=Clostridium sp. LIBA-8841 TaxID=2987530 RepID=UPI002AC3FE0C|nr:prepilin-type N-terminal cleavage/methylation domain-containing protein [Clostridium sp. LIBA-8841]MDZ5255059.1 prepilin-type N-terminal cleavage/methylation domain-containing protein [Clostridium sp. LIBA-8841]
MVSLKNTNFKKEESRKKKKKGFTLIELTVVLAIMAIIITVIAPNFSSVKEGARTKVDEQNCAAIERSVEMLLAEDVIESSTTNIKIEPNDSGVEISGISGDGESKLQELLEDLDKPQSGDFYNVNIENGRKVKATTGKTESF